MEEGDGWLEVGRRGRPLLRCTCCDHRYPHSLKQCPRCRTMPSKKQSVTVQAIRDTDEMECGSSSGCTQVYRLGDSIRPRGFSTSSLKKPTYYDTLKPVEYERDEMGVTWNEDEESEETDDEAKTITASQTTSSVFDFNEEDDRLLYEAINEATKYSQDAEDVHLITFDGFYRKNDKVKTGGYGAVLWTGGLDGGPFAAVGGSSLHKFSAFYHAFEGLLHGLYLAKKFDDIKWVYCVCNSHRVSQVVQECFISNNEGGCRRHPRKDGDIFCVCCLSELLWAGDSLPDVVNVMKQIIDVGKQYRRRGVMVNAVCKGWNRPADYMAKMVSHAGNKKELSVDDFPVELKDLFSEFGEQSPFNIL